ncbi:Uncharacterised protein [Mycobacteroides abscessus subsp. massiliense]|nr:Uncharacterised protein [Mycobacteroides abscessus subsp. massiliense]SKF43568.1 Uncharacterised protein [Mycobacteroides abscessus subsp. massiliense]SKF45329.1 Uncharacterised protein [Mycobacteroides abscessus subsp. massiliense]SKF48222.1 Uncharacterised protein [Mycobacteroides abscessus subsp. massiliense]SKF50177.1 Uncharacterised protein [Mycobacteroides abscessus subsp. massiliense]
MVRDLKSAFRTRGRVLSIATDPGMDDDVKLFAFCLQAYIIGRDLPRGWGSRDWTEVVGEMMAGGGSVSLKAYGPVGVCMQGAWVGYCRNHSHPVLDQWRLERLRAWDANGRPSPPANTGGALTRHFTGDWPGWYQWALSWHPGLGNDVRRTVPSPSFTLIEGDGQDGPERGPRPQQRLSVVSSNEQLDRTDPSTVCAWTVRRR